LNHTVNSLTVSGANIFAGTNGYGVFLSKDSGITWVESGVFRYPIRALAASGNSVFAGAEVSGIFRSTNNGTSWTSVTSDPSCDAIKCIAANGSTILAGTDFGSVFLSTDNGTNWSECGRFSDIRSVSINGNSIFAATNGSGIYRSTDSGANWSQVNTGLTNKRIYSLALSGSNIFAGADAGNVFLSTDNGTNWIAVNDGLPVYSTITILTVSDGNIFAGTSGCGVWRRPISEMAGSFIRSTQGEDCKQFSYKQFFTTRTNHRVNINFSLPSSEKVTLNMYSLSGLKIKGLINKYLYKGFYSIKWEIQNVPTGCYVVKMQIGSNMYAKSIPVY
jgi:photosystem II stability/assembly factor-like uncharacterized protein